MIITVTDPGIGLHIYEKKYELIRLENKYYIELDNFNGAESVVELSISLAAENEALRERIKTLEKKIIFLQKNPGIRL